MADEKQAVKTLAEELAKAIKSVSSNVAMKTVSNIQNASTVDASKVVGLPAAISSIFSGLESAAASGDAIAITTLQALNHIAAGEFETITSDTAQIDKLYATYGEFMSLVAENAQIGDLDVGQIRSDMADIGLINIGTARISSAQIDRASTGTLLVREEIGGKVFIDDLAVTNANIVSLAAGQILLNNSNGELVELYADSSGNILTRAVSYDGDDIITQNSLNGSRIVENSITTNRLNASEIFAKNGTVLDLVADNINVNRLFANEAFIPLLETSIIQSPNIGSGIDLTNNTSIKMMEDSIELIAASAGGTFIQSSQPFPLSARDTWFDPIHEEHYVVNRLIPVPPDFSQDDDGYLVFTDNNDYDVALNSDGYLMIETDEEDLEFDIADDGYLTADGIWRKVENLAFSNLKIAVDGISSEVFDPITGTSRIQQNAGAISAVVTGDTSVPYVKTSSVEIKNDSVNISSTGNVNITAKQFSISFNTSGSLIDKNRVEISNDKGIKVSDQYGGYFQATNNKIGLYDYQGNAKLWMDSNGDANFSGKLSAASGTFSGALNAATGTFAGTLDASCINSGYINVDRIQGNSIAVSKLTGSISNGNWVLNLENGTFSIGNISADKINSGYISADRIEAGSIGGAKIAVNAITTDKINAGAITSAKLADAVNNSISTAQSTANGANSETQLIYISKASGTTSVSGTTTWVTSSADIQNAWSLKRPTYNSSYPVVFVATQKKTVAGTVTCTTPIKDDTTTVIDGGHITTGTIDASVVTVTKLNASNITTGTLSADRIAANSIAVGKLTGSISNNNWVLNFSNGSFTIGNISADKINSGYISADRIEAGSIGGAKIANSAITAAKIDANAVTSDKINAGAVVAGKIATNAVTADKINTGAVTADKIAAGAITAEKITADGISANVINGGVLRLGGKDNKYGQLTMYSDGNQYGGFWDNRGIGLNNGTINIHNQTNSRYITLTTNDTIGISMPFVYHDYVESSSMNTELQCWIEDDSLKLYKWLSNGTIYGTIISPGNIEVSGNLTAHGTKSRVVTTDQYSDRTLYCYETPTPMFGDLGEGEISDNGDCYIWFDSIFAQTVVTTNYQVYLQKYGDGDCYVSERKGNCFVVKGTPGLQFGWEIKAKQRDYDQLRLEDRNREPFTVPPTKYGEDAAKHIEDIKRERDIK